MIGRAIDCFEFDSRPVTSSRLSVLRVVVWWTPMLYSKCIAIVQC